MDLFITETLLNDMRDGNSCMDLPEGKAFALFTVNSKKYIVVASCSSGANGTEWVLACECVPLIHFKGQSLTYNEHRKLVDNNERERGYKNVIFSFKNQEWVILSDSISFYPVREETQLTLF